MADACPPPRDLESFAVGGDGAAPVGGHVQRCVACRELVDEIRENQRFLRGAARALASALDRPTNPASTPGSVAGFELIEEISRGGQGIVYRAVQTATKRPAAVKMLLTGSLASSRQQNRFEREIEYAARLRHPNIVSIFESGVTADGRRYVAMEYVEGETLDRYVRTHLAQIPGRAGIDRIMRICADVAAAVGHAHANGVIHRDLKLSNIMVDGAGNPRVLDFGLARDLDSIADPTMTREFAGTPAFAAPEQFAGEAVSIDARTDVYALGVVFYAALTGTHPYPCEGPLSAVIEHVRSTEPKPPSAHVPRIPTDVDTIVLKALSKEPGRRYLNAQALAADIQDYLAGRPISARRDSTLYVLRKLAQRHRTPAAIAGVALFAIITAAIGLAVLSSRLDSQRRRAEAALAESNLQRARLLAKTGDVLRAEQMLWQEALAAGVAANDEMGLESTPAGRRAAWGLMELYSMVPKSMTVVAERKPVSMSFVTDGRRLEVIEEDGAVEQWSMDGRRLLRKPGFLPTTAQFSIDQRRAARTDDGGALSVYDMESRVLVCGPKSLPTAAYLKSISDDGGMIAVIDDCGTAFILDTASLTSIRTFEGGITYANFDRGDLFLTVQLGARPAVLVYSLPDFTLVNTLLLPDDHKDYVSSAPARVSPDGAHVLVALQSSLYLYDAVAGGDPIVIRNGTSPICARIEFDADGRKAVSATRDGNMTIWSVPELQPLEVLRNMSMIGACAIHGELAAAANQDASITVWPIGQNDWLTRRPGFNHTTHGLAISPDGTTLAAGDDEGWLTVAYTSTRATNEHPVQAHRGAIRSIDFAPSGDRFLTAGMDGAVREWTAQGVRLRDVSNDLGNVWCVRYSSDGDWIAAGGADGRVHLWTKEGNSTVCLMFNDRIRIPQLEFSPDSRLLASLAVSGEVILWDVQSATRVRTIDRRAISSRAIAFSPDGRTIAVGADDRTIRFWDVKTGALRGTMSGLPWGPFDMEYHPSGRVLFAVGHGGEIVVIDVESYAELATFRAHERIIMALRMSRGGRQLITAGEDDWIGFWDVDFLRRCAAGNFQFNRTRIENEARP